MRQPSANVRALCAAMALAAGIASPAAVAGQVEVRWSHPEAYSDAGRNVVDRERALHILGKHLQALGRRLPAEQTLVIEVTDVDLAGEIEPFSRDQWRVLRGRADWPRMSLRYALKAGEQTLRSGESRLATLDYLDGRHIGDLPYERRMIEDWFAQTFATPITR